jgi:3D (Asp-Asp-Asp) domain-containing protein
LSFADPLGLVKAVCVATSTGGVGYEGSRKVCEYRCTANGQTLTVRGYCDDVYGEKICYGVPITGTTTNRTGQTRANTGDPRLFNIDTRSWVDKYIRYDSRLATEIEAQACPKEKEKACD